MATINSEIISSSFVTSWHFPPSNLHIPFMSTNPVDKNNFSGFFSKSNCMVTNLHKRKNFETITVVGSDIWNSPCVYIEKYIPLIPHTVRILLWIDTYQSYQIHSSLLHWYWVNHTINLYQCKICLFYQKQQSLNKILGLVSPRRTHKHARQKYPMVHFVVVLLIT